MPSRPRSSLDEFGSELSLEAMSMNSLLLATFALFWKTRTDPVFCTTYQREELPGACSMATGWVKFGRLANTRWMPKDTGGGSPATQVVFEGRASRPETPGAGGGGNPLVVALAAADAADSFAGVAPSKA